MTLLDDTFDCHGGYFDPMGDPLLIRRPDLGPYHVYCYACQQKTYGETPLEQAKAKLKLRKPQQTSLSLSPEQWDALGEYLEALDE